MCDHLVIPCYVLSLQYLNSLCVHPGFSNDVILEFQVNLEIHVGVIGEVPKDITGVQFFVTRVSLWSHSTRQILF